MSRNIPTRYHCPHVTAFPFSEIWSTFCTRSLSWWFGAIFQCKGIRKRASMIKCMAKEFEIVMLREGSCMENVLLWRELYTPIGNLRGDR